MSQMVRKQIYIQKGQKERLKKIAEARGVSEAEIIRRALEIELRHARYHSAYNRDAWMRIRGFVMELKKSGSVRHRKRDWKREDLYEERMKRYDRSAH